LPDVPHVAIFDTAFFDTAGDPTGQASVDLNPA
jgi:acetate kinase